MYKNAGGLACISIAFCEFRLFMNIKYLHKIRDNKVNQAFLIYFFYMHGEAYRQGFMKFPANFNQNLMDWFLEPFHKFP